MECQSHRFGIPDEVAYLNCSYMGPLTHETVAAGHQAMLRKQQPFTIGVQDFFEPVDDLKQNFATLVNAPEPLRVSVMPSVSYGLATVARNLPVSKGENVIALEEQFPSNIYCWTRLCKEQGLELRIISAPHAKKGRGELWNTKILESIDEKTAAVAVGTVHWADGTLFDLKAIRKRTREVGAMLIVDGTQTVGAMPFDVAEVNPDALICAGYKWLLGPYSLALAYFGPAFDGGIPLEENWINRIGSDDFKGLVRYQEQYHPYAVRYDMGEKSNFFLVPMLNESIGQILNWGVQNIQNYCESISGKVLQKLESQGFLIEDSQYRAHNIFGIRFPEHYRSNNLQSRLEESKVFISYRGDAIRVAPHIYNREEHLDSLYSCLIEGLS